MAVESDGMQALPQVPCNRDPNEESHENGPLLDQLSSGTQESDMELPGSGPVPMDGRGEDGNGGSLPTGPFEPEKNPLSNLEINLAKGGTLNKRMEEPIGLRSFIMATPKNALKVFFKDPPRLDDQKAFFDRWKAFFLCEDCHSAMRSNGFANKSYRLVCKEKGCNKSVSFRLAMLEAAKAIKDVYPDLAPVAPIIPKAKKGRISFKGVQPEEEAEPVTAMDVCNGQDNEEAVEGSPEPSPSQPVMDWQAKFHAMAQKNAALQQQRDHLLSLLKSQEAKTEELEEKLARQEARIARLEARGGGSPTRIETRKATPMPSGTPSFAQMVVEGPKPDQGANPPRQADPPARKLTPEQLGRVLKGLSPNPPRTINAVFAVGITAQKIGKLKKLLKEQCEVSLRNILHIDFIGKSVTEFHVYSDYAENFKRQLTAASPSISFLDIDPLDTALLRNDAAEDKVSRAAELYARRLERRLSTTPSKGHKVFLRQELARARLVSTGRMEH
jgi:hypothetical protein